MTRTEYFGVATRMAAVRPQQERITISQQTLFNDLANHLSDHLWQFLTDEERSQSATADIRGFREVATGARATPPRRQ